MSPEADLDEVLKAFRQKLMIDPENPWDGKKWYRRTIDQAREDKPRATARWKTSAAFWAPAPFDGRPVSASGHTTFHFDRSVCARASQGSKVVCSSGFTRVVKGNAAGGHHAYINESAAICEEEGHSAYVRGSPDAMEPLDVSGPRPIYRGRTTHTFSNIHESPEVAGGYWRWIHESSPVPGPDRMRVDPGRLPAEQWRELANRWSNEPEVAQLLLEAADQAEDAATAVQEGRVKRFITLPDGAGKRLLKDARQCEGWIKGKPAIKVTEGRGGKTQERLVAEFPAELPLHRQAVVAARFCQFMNELGFFFEAAIHEPDHDNDVRNGHLHINYHDRAAAYDEANRQWQNPPNGRTGKRGRPKRSNVPCLRQEGVSGLNLAGDLLRVFRRKFAELVNFELIQSGHFPRYHPGTHEELGIDQKPAEHLGNDAAKLASAGVPVPGDLRNAARSCEGEWRRRLGRLFDEQDRRRDTIEKLWRTLRRLSVDDPRRAKFQSRLRQLSDGLTELKQLGEGVAEARMYHDMANNRAARTQRMATRILRAIEGGNAGTADARQREDIAHRLTEADRHKAEVTLLYSPALPAEDRLRTLEAQFEAEAASLQLDMAAQRNPKEPPASQPTSPEFERREGHQSTVDGFFDAIAKKLVVLPVAENRQGFSRLAGLNAQELALMRAYKARGLALAQARQRHQQLEIWRLQEFREDHPEQWSAMAASRTPPPGVPKAILTLFARYREHWGELVPSIPPATVVTRARAQAGETFQGKERSGAPPSAPPAFDPTDDQSSRDEQIALALDYVEIHGALRRWTGEKWSVDVTSLPPEHRWVFERAELADYVQENLEDMNYRLRRDFASGASRPGNGHNPDGPV